MTHGDACLPNLMIDPETLHPQDLALLTRSAGDADLNPAFAALRIDAALDPWRVEFYRLLDEFF